MTNTFTVIIEITIPLGAHGSLTPCESTGVEELRNITKNALPSLSAPIQGSKNVYILQMPRMQSTFCSLVVICDEAKFSYRTMWLNDVADWESGHNNKATM